MWIFVHHVGTGQTPMKKEEDCLFTFQPRFATQHALTQSILLCLKLNHVLQLKAQICCMETCKNR